MVISLWVQISLFLFLFFYYEYGVFFGGKVVICLTHTNNHGLAPFLASF